MKHTLLADLACYKSHDADQNLAVSITFPLNRAAPATFLALDLPLRQCVAYLAVKTDWEDVGLSNRQEAVPRRLSVSACCPAIRRPQRHEKSATLKSGSRTTRTL